AVKMSDRCCYDGEAEWGGSRTTGGRTGSETKSGKEAGTRGFAASGADGGEPGMGGGSRARCDGQRPSPARAQRGGRMHAGMPDPGSGHEFCEPASNASAGTDLDRTGKAPGDSL